MKRNELRRKLVLSIISVMFAFACLGTSTFAWFAMNDTVKASGMSISVTNESSYLIIGTKEKTEGAATPTITSLRAENLVEVDLAGQYANPSGKPVAHLDITKLEDAEAMSEGKYANWYTKTADAPTSYESTKDAVNLTSLDNYVLFYDLYIAVTEGSVEMENLMCNVNITATEDKKVRDAVRVLVVSDTACEEFYNAHTQADTDTEAHTTGEIVLATSIKASDTEPIHIRVYVYIDGNDNTVYTNNTVNFAQATIKLEFTASQK